MKPEENYVDLVEDIIQEVFDKELNKQEKICITLSSGVDSTLLATLLKHHFPEKKIRAVSVKFSESNDESKDAKKIAEKLDIDHTIIHIALLNLHFGICIGFILLEKQKHCLTVLLLAMAVMNCLVAIHFDMRSFCL